jgi:hypothetical protein
VRVGGVGLQAEDAVDAKLRVGGLLQRQENVDALSQKTTKQIAQPLHQTYFPFI